MWPSSSIQGPGSSKGVPGQFEPEARALGLRVQRVEASDPSAFDAIFASMEQSGVDALMIMDHSLFNAYRQQLLALALRHRLPTVCAARAYAEAGCLMAYAPNLAQMGRRAATYIDKILKGAKPADLPVEQPMKFEFGINLKTAQTLGLTILPTLLFQADEVIR